MGNPSCTVEYTVQHIIYSRDNYFVIKMKDVKTNYPEKIKTGAGTFLEEVRIGDHFKSSASITDTKYGRQFLLESSIITLPSNKNGIKNFMIKKLPHIGRATADVIYDKYGTNSLYMLRTDPDALADIKGISKKRAEKIYAKMQGFASMEVLADFIFSLGVTNFQYVVDIYGKFKEKSIDLIKSNPYILCTGLGASMLPVADTLASGLGLSSKNMQRYESIIILALEGITYGGGHTCAGYQALLNESARILRGSSVFGDENGIDLGLFNECIIGLSKAKQIELVKDKKNGNTISLYSMNFAEKVIARGIKHQLSQKEQDFAGGEDVDDLLRTFENERGMKLDALQKQAVVNALSHRISIITGGPGTGKTTTINAIIDAFKRCRKRVKIGLAAPTGRASKRMTELCGEQAGTIHRLCGLQQQDLAPIEDTEFTEENLDVLIVDESSMIDTMLFARLLSATVKQDMWLVIVGDAEQLPSVGPGLCLRDLIECGHIPVTFLQTLFRQDENSLIHINADHIKKGHGCGNGGVTFSQTSDCSLLPCETESEFIRITSQLVMHYLKNGVKPDNITILTPMRKGTSGSVELNKVLREIFIPRKSATSSVTFGNMSFRLGERVMQTVNNYDLMVFNGEIGTVVKVDNEEKQITVRYPDSENGTVDVEYDKDYMNDLELAYAMTVHKAQGSEMPLVIIPAIDYYNYDRNLLYTALTRAKKQVIFIGNERSVNRVISKQRSFNRMTGLLEMMNREME